MMHGVYRMGSRPEDFCQMGSLFNFHMVMQIRPLQGLQMQNCSFLLCIDILVQITAAQDI